MRPTLQEGDHVEALADFWFGPLNGKTYTVRAGTRGEVRSVYSRWIPDRLVVDVLFEGTDQYARLDVGTPDSVVKPIQVQEP